MVEIDGQLGEGGGQILRSSLSLSMLTGQPFTLENIRKRRARPGLMRQHLTAVNAALALCDGRARGNEPGSERLTFTPGSVRHGEYAFAIGTAGSTTLVLQTLLPALLAVPGASRLILEGGTHNPLAPSCDFLQWSFLALLRRLGASVDVRLETAGFYPAGGGRLVVDVEGAGAWQPLTLVNRGPLRSVHVQALLANLPRHVGEREVSCLAALLQPLLQPLLPPELTLTTEVSHLSSPGPGNALNAKLDFEAHCQCFVGFGEKRISAERVARALAEQVRAYLASEAAVEPYLADQLLLPLAMGAGGQFTTSELSSHTATNIDVIQRFLRTNIEVSRLNDGACRIDVMSGR